MTLSEIIERLEKAKCGDRELDALIWCYFAGVKYATHHEPYGGGPLTQVAFTMPPKRARIVTGNGHGSNPLYQHATPVTSSVDAAIALAEKVLPAWQVVGFESNWSGPYPAYGAKENVQSRAWVARTKHSHVESEGVAATPAIALCLAILKAKQMGVGE